MKSFDKVYRYNETQHDDIIDANLKDEHLNLLLKPDSNEGGINTTQKVFDSLYTYDEENGKNTSPTYSFEIWYDEGIFEFFLHTKDTSSERHLRKQLSSKFPDSEFDSTPTKFLKPNHGDYVFCGDIILKKPFFEPVSDDTRDPYEPIFAEIDNKDNTKAILQFVIQPAKKDWTDTFRRSAEDYAENLENAEKVIRRKFGFKKDKVSDELSRKQANKVKEQVGKIGFKIDMKIIIAHPNKKLLLDLVKQLNNILELEYESPTGQSLTIKEYNDDFDYFLNQISSREIESLDYKGISSAMRELKYLIKGKGYNENIVMSTDELSNVAHIPNESEVPQAPVKWTNSPATRVPPELNDLKGLNSKEEKKLVDMLMKKRKEFRKKI